MILLLLQPKSNYVLKKTEIVLSAKKRYCAALIGSKLYLVGGRNGQRCFKEGTVVNLASGEKKNIAPMSVARCGMNLVSHKGYLYAIGGFDDD